MPRCSSSSPVSTSTARSALVGLQPVQRRQALRVGQVEVEQHAVDALELLAARVGERLRAHDLDVRAADGQQLLDEQRVAVVVLDEQDADRRRGRRGSGAEPC